MGSGTAAQNGEVEVLHGLDDPQLVPTSTLLQLYAQISYFTVAPGGYKIVLSRIDTVCTVPT